MNLRDKSIAAGILGFVVALLMIGMTTIATPLVVSDLSGPAGNFAVSITDPPIVPTGVTAVYISYFDLAVHSADSNGWTVIQQGGSLNLMSLVGVSQTIAAANLPAGTYDQLRFNISAASVTFAGKNYTAFVPSAELKMPIIGGIQVNNTSTSVALIDLTPTVINIGSSATPEFLITPVAKAYTIPPGSVSPQMKHEGDREDLSDAILTTIQEGATANLKITQAALSNSSLSLTVQNTGHNTTTLRLVIVRPVASITSGSENDSQPLQIPSAIPGSMVFFVTANGKLIPASLLAMLGAPGAAGDHNPNSGVYNNNTGDNNANANDHNGHDRGDNNTATGDNSTNTGGNNANNTEDNNIILPINLKLGFPLAAGSNVTLSYSGQIVFRMNENAAEPNIPAYPSVVPGGEYIITVIGTDALASIIVTAS
jgi:hypothetical protein